MGTSIKKVFTVLTLLLTAVVVLLIIFQVEWGYSGTVHQCFSLRPIIVESQLSLRQVKLKEVITDSPVLNSTLELNNASAVSHHPVSVSTELNESIRKDLYRCSLAMGVASDVLEMNRDKINLLASGASHFLNAFWEVVPKNYLPTLKNPCWYSKVHNNRSSRRLYCLPHFLLPGVPKSGTTTLHHAISQHPQIVSPTGPIAGGKEPQWWYRLPLKDTRVHLKQRTLRYIKHFQKAADRINTKFGRQIITYDGSQMMLIDIQDYSFSIDNEDYCVLAAMLSRILPKEKIVVIMRDPVLRAYAHFVFFHHNVTTWPDEMKKNTSLYFNNHIQVALQDFDKCLTQNRSIYECTNEVRTYRNELKFWLGTGIYYNYILKWMQF